jgi:hypothetical protein
MTPQRQNIVNAYHRMFRSEEGNIVLKDLKTAFGFELPAFIPITSKPGAMPNAPGVLTSYDPIYAAIRDGQRQVILHINTQLELPVTGDANIDNKAIVIT